MESISCGSWLACDGGLTAARCAGWQAAIAGKPAPTLISALLRSSNNQQLHSALSSTLRNSSG
ncbi:hypothetical protein C1751_02365 [Pseudomonas fluorescens]|nr:hypothetical protein C1751_02365 [Pseudomonas fluorescens]